MKQPQIKFLKSLCEAITPSGWETEGQRLVADYVRPFADFVTLDCHGNLHAVVNADAPIRIMLDGHCDEIGLIVQHVDDKGFIYVQPVGGINTQLLPGERVVFQGSKGRVRGVIGRKAIHLMSAKEREEGIKDISDLWVDIGATNAKEALEVLPLGSPGIVESGWRELMNGLVSARAFDDRAGVFVVIDALRRLQGRKLNVAVHVVSATQEELGLLGATTAAYGINPHAGIAVDVTFASDDPGGVPKKTGIIKVGGGPVLGVGPAYDHALNAMIRKAGETAKIPIQVQPRSRGNGTDAFAIRQTRTGVPVAQVSIPLRYMHSAVEVLSLADLDQCAQLIADTVAAIPANPRFGAKF
ncbi:MAG: M28 family peptidase [Kiritimatiellia bacterium]|jgi:putative aminopeptidase FrvX